MSQEIVLYPSTVSSVFPWKEHTAENKTASASMAELLLLGFQSCRHKQCITHPVLRTVRVVNKKTEKVQGNLMIGDFLALASRVPVHVVQ